MPKSITIPSLSKARATHLCLSDDWDTLQPWTHKGEPVPYLFAYRWYRSKTGKVDFTYIYFGPFAVISGKWVGGDQDYDDFEDDYDPEPGDNTSQ
jgi:hypothetical protein